MPECAVNNKHNNNHNTMDSKHKMPFGGCVLVMLFCSFAPYLFILISFLLLSFFFLNFKIKRTKLNDGERSMRRMRALTVNLCTLSLWDAFHMNINSDLIWASHSIRNNFFLSSHFIQPHCGWHCFCTPFGMCSRWKATKKYVYKHI